MEYKLHGTDLEALHQIQDKNYAAAYQGSGKEIVCMGLSFNHTTGLIDAWEVA